MAYETVCSCFRGCVAYGSCWFPERAFGATRSSALRTSTPQAARSPAPFRTCSNPSSSWSSGSSVLRFQALATGPSIHQFSGSLAPYTAVPAPVPRLLGPPVLRLLGLLPPVPRFFSSPVLWSLIPPHRHPAADYLRASLASMHSVAWGTFIRRSFGMSLPVVLQMP